MQARIISVAVIILLLLAGAGMAGDIRNTQLVCGFKAGLFSAGTYYISDFYYAEFDSDMGMSFGGFLDYKLAEKLSGGLALDYSTLGVYEESVSLIDFSATLKALIYSQNSNLTFRPGFGFGYGSVTAIGPVEGSTYLMLKGILEAIITMKNGMNVIAEIQIIGGTSGGNDDHDMSFGPGFLVRGGLAF